MDPAATPPAAVCPVCGGVFTPRHSPRGLTRHCSVKCGQASRRSRPAVPRSRDLSEAEAAWLAGLLDGEGSVVWTKPGTKSVRVAIYNTSAPLLSRVLEVAGYGSITDGSKRRSPKHKQGYAWVCCGVHAIHLLAQMLPWLIVKHDKAGDAVDFYAGSDIEL